MRTALLAILVVSLLAVPSLAFTGADAANNKATVARGPANEVWLAVNPTDSMNIIATAKDYTGGSTNACFVHNVWAGIYASHDGGVTWRNTEIPRGPILSTYPCSSDPIVTFGSDGTAYFEGLALGIGGGAPFAIWNAVSKDGGNTISAVTIASATSSGFYDKDNMAVDSTTGVIYDAWVDINTGQILVATGIPVAGSFQWLPPVKVGGTGSDPLVSVLPGGLVQVNWINGLGGSQIFSATAPPLAQKFLPKSTAVNGIAGAFGIANVAFRAFTLPQSAVDSNGVVYLTWHAYNGGHTDIFLSHSAALGQGPWTTPVVVNQDGSGHDHVMSNVAVSPDAKHVAVGYYDRRDDPGNKLITPYVSISTDGGATFTDHRVGDVLFNGDFGYHQSGFSFIGDYVGVAATNGGVYMAWGDTRNFAAPATGSDIYEGFTSF
ncbi:MAG: hypothetical protein ACYDCK_07080 [Thermoplasmatota archaeon]